MEALREGWGVLHADGRWVVGIVNDSCFECGASFDRLAEDGTIDGAITAAVAVFEQREREAADRRAAYARRKANGELTALEQAMEATLPIWSEDVVQAVKGHAVMFSHLVDRTFEDEIRAASGDVFRMPQRGNV